MTATSLTTIQSWAELSSLILAEEPSFKFIYIMFVNKATHPCWKCGLWVLPMGNCIRKFPDYSEPKCGWIRNELNKVTVPFHRIEQIRFSDLTKWQAGEVEAKQHSEQNPETHFLNEKLRSALISARMRLKLTHKEEAIFDLAFEYPYLFEFFFNPKGHLPKDVSDLFNEFNIQLYFKDTKSLINAIQRLKSKFKAVIIIDPDRKLPVWERIEVIGDLPDWGDDKRYNPSYPRIMRAFEYEKEKKDYSPIDNRG